MSILQNIARRLRAILRFGEGRARKQLPASTDERPRHSYTVLRSRKLVSRS